MMTMKSKGSLLVTLGILLTVGIASLIVSSESFAEEVGQTNIGVTFYGGKEPLKTEGVIKPIEQPVTDKDKKTSQQQDKVSRKTTAKTNPTNAQTSLPRTERNSTWLYSLGIACLLVVLTSFYYLNKKRKKEK